ncbi:zinc finger MYM-type protein 1-like, partial [Aphis gossypii]|uniref:zinc finger MYM-type protein 1-like n=1 Tax=Aphis gossypii TaxID=80765 RepID=UPI002158F40D
NLQSFVDPKNILFRQEESSNYSMITCVANSTDLTSKIAISQENESFVEPKNPFGQEESSMVSCDTNSTDLTSKVAISQENESFVKPKNPFGQEESSMVCCDTNSTDLTSKVAISQDVNTEFQQALSLVNPKDPSLELPKNRLELRNIIISGPYQPQMSFPRTLIGLQYRGFLKHYYDTYKWIEYSPVKNAAFCFPCRIFKGNSLNSSQIDLAFSTRGYTNWKNATKAFNNHQKSKVHNYSSESMFKFVEGNSIDIAIDEGKKLQLSQQEQERLKNRDFFKRLIDIIILLAKSGKPFRGHDESVGSFNKGIKLSVILQNKKISIIADETSDVGHHEQMSLVVRYFDSKLNQTVEHFLCLQRLTSVDAQSIFDSINNVLINKLGLSWSSVIAVCFDGAATMSGCNNGVQAKCKEKNNALIKNRVVFDFFGTIHLIYAFIEGSCIRHAILEKVARQINIKLVTLKSISTTRWACRSEAITAIKSNYSVLIIAIQEIYDSTKLPDVRAKAHGLIIQMQSFNFIFALNMLESILLIILKVSSSLQSKDLDLLAAVDLIKSLKHTITHYRSVDDEYNKIYEETLEMCNENNIEIPQSLQSRKP